MYSQFQVNNKTFDLTHLNPQTFNLDIDSITYTATLTFGHHCFTDQKNTGNLFCLEKRKNGKTPRYWSNDRYQDSLLLPSIIKKLFSNNRDYYITPFKPYGSGEQYHYLDNGYFAIFFYINKIDIQNRNLSIYVVSAYDKKTYNGNTPQGKSYKLSWVLSQRINGKFVI